MEYLGAILPVSEPPSPSLSSLDDVSPGASQAASKRSSVSHLDPPALSPAQLEPAPYRADPGDHISLGQVFEPREELSPELDDIVDTLERPSMIRAATVSHKESPTLHKGLPHSKHGQARPSAMRAKSTPYTAIEKAKTTLFSLDSADATRYYTTTFQDEADEEDPKARSEDRPLPKFVAVDPKPLEDDDPSGNDLASYEWKKPHVHSGIPVSAVSKAVDQLDAEESEPATRGWKKPHLHSGIPVPAAIMLRRASSKAVAPRDREFTDAVGGLVAHHEGSRAKRRPSPRTSVNTNLINLLSTKGPVLSPALTHTYVHTFSPNSAQDLRKDSLSFGRRRSSATLQVVRSRDSVYEVIWEDEDLLESTEDHLPSSSSSTMSPAPDENRRQSISSASLLQRKPECKHLVDTRMFRFSWEGHMQADSATTSKPLHCPVEASITEDSPVPEPTPAAFEPHKASPVEHELFLPPTEHPKPLFEPELPEEETPEELEPIPFLPLTEEPKPSSGPQTAEEESAPVELEPMPRRGSSPRPPPSPHFGGHHSSPKLRQQLLGKRKMSDMSPESESLIFHRDSLVLAHKRIFHEDLEQAESRVGNALVHGHAQHGSQGGSRRASVEEEPRIAALRRESWHRPAATTSSSSRTLSSLEELPSPTEESKSAEEVKPTEEVKPIEEVKATKVDTARTQLSDLAASRPSAERLDAVNKPSLGACDVKDVTRPAMATSPSCRRVQLAHSVADKIRRDRDKEQAKGHGGTAHGEASDVTAEWARTMPMP